MVALVSEYGDGEVIARIAKGVGGFIPVRGSSTRGGAKAFLEMIKRFRGNHWVITPDGDVKGRIPIVEDVLTNVTFGGDDLKTLYVAAGKTLFTTRVEIPGWVVHRRNGS